MKFQAAVLFSAIICANAFTAVVVNPHQVSPSRSHHSALRLAAEESAAPASPAPVLNGKMVLPCKIVANGLEGHKVAAVYAVMNNTYKRGKTKGWKECVYVGTTEDLQSLLGEYLEKHGAETVAHIRALSFTFPQPDAMNEVAEDWRQQAMDAGAILAEWNDEAKAQQIAAIEAILDLEDDDDDDDDIDFDDMDLDDIEMMGGPPAVPPPPPTPVDNGVKVSPFEKSDIAEGSDGELEFNLETVDKVLDEVRPYLISDGGNVSVDSVDTATKNVYLKLEGACGSCASSTVTMQMGIERVLKEKFADLGEVIQVLDEEEAPTELTMEAVQTEVNRISPAIIAMGGVIRIVSVDPIGVVEINFRGANKVRQGLELALLDVPFVKHVKFVMED